MPALLRLPPQKDDVGTLAADASLGRSVDVLEVIDENNAIIRAWYRDPAAGSEATFLDMWLRGIDTKSFAAGNEIKLSQTLQVTGNQSIDTTCGRRSFWLVEPK